MDKMSRRKPSDVPPINLDNLSRDNTMTSTRASRRGTLRMSRQNTKAALSRGGTDLSVAATHSTRQGKRKTNTGMKNLEEELKKAMPKGWNIREGFQPLLHFKKIVRFVIVFMKWIMALREEAEKTGGGGSEAITGLLGQDFASALVTADGTTFDVKDYQSKKEVLLSSDVREILNQHPTLRSKEQVQTAKYGLQNVKSFSEYPLHMQEKIATVAYYQEIDAKRVIIREGHVAENFYFILSGTCLSRKLTNQDIDEPETPYDDDDEDKKEEILTKGDSFGELELLHHSKRQVTIVSRTPMTLLVVGRDNFFEIFMSSQDENSLPDHIKFLSSLEVMKGFPVHLWVENSEKCLLHFFRRGAVIVKDSQDSEWLYVIKSGSCEVLKNLKGVSQKHLLDTTKKAPMREQKLPVDLSLSLPRLNIGKQSSKTDSGFKSLPPPKPKNPSKKQEVKSNEPENKQKDILDIDFLSKQDDHLPLLQMEKKLADDIEFRESYREMMESLDVPRDLTTPHRNAIRNKQGGGHTKSRFNELTVIKRRKRPVAVSPLPAYAVDMVRKPKVTFDDVTQVEIIEADDRELDRPSIDALSINKDGMKALLKKESAPVFVQVDLLKPRDVFGLANIRFDEFLENKSMSVSLVSRGAECIMVEKKFFVDNAPQEVRHAVMSLIRPYPDTDTLQGNLMIKASWEDYRDTMLKTAQDRVTEKKSEYKKTFSVY